MYSSAIQKLIEAFSCFPSVGQRTAERFVFHLLKSGKGDVAILINALKGLVQNIKSCEMCCDFCEKSPCQICSDLKRDRSIICVVAEPQDSETIEKTNSYSGLYHILRGTLEPEENLDESKLKIKELIKRAHDSKIKEIMLALNPDMQGEATMMYLEKKIKEANPKIKITRLAKGLPTGSDLQYADEITLASAIKNRTIKKDPL